MRTLVVDDSLFIRGHMRELLERLGTEITEAEHGRAALDLLRGGQRFELMLVDVNMPVMNGLECVRCLRDEALDPEMKVMMVTTESDHRFIETALSFGADEFLMKPFTAQSLHDKLLLLGFELTA